MSRFEREARTAALLSGHPHVITIYDVGEQAGRPFIVMEHLAGGTLAERMAGSRPSRQDVLEWLREAAVGARLRAREGCRAQGREAAQPAVR